ncbi:MAG TPA: helix-turn-helix transcriptional regulator [Actinocrinis sp.]|nr:helix-turn-helix transcriptional regulator [Actinocrinis sp.]
MPQATPSRQGQARTTSHAPHAVPAPQVPPPPATRAGAGAGAAAASNSALRQLRLRRFWTQADFAAAFEARSRQIGRPLSLSVRQVRRWESDNPPLPLPAYQAVLEALFGVPIERMGFQPQWARQEADPPDSGSDGSVDRGAGVTRSPDDDHERHDPVKRRQFMTGAVALGSGGLAAAAPATARASARPPYQGLPQQDALYQSIQYQNAVNQMGPQQPEAAARLAEHRGGGAAAVDSTLVAGYAAITVQHRALYWSVAATAMFAPVAAHSELGVGLLRATDSPALRTRLAHPVAETALLAARLAFFDLQQPRLADSYFTVALNAAREAADRALTGAVLAHMAFVPAFVGRARRARDLMALAHDEAAGAIGPVQRSWMYAVESEVEARLGAPAAAGDLIARSEGALGALGATGATGMEPDWLDFYDASRLAGFKGYCQMATGRTGEAAASLERTLRTLPASGAKQRSITLADLAHVRAQQGELEESARLLGGAIAQLHRSWYATGVDRVDGVRRRLMVLNVPPRVLAPVEEARHTLEAVRP